ncbi:MAG: spermidine N1-acetyltransferase [Gammaproteobacteria bacterium]
MDNTTERLIIRIMEQQDIEAARQLHNEHSTLFKLADINHVTATQQQRWFESISLSATARRYSVLEKQTREFVGLFRVDDLSYQHRSVCVGLDIVPEKRGKGYATESFLYFFDYYFNQMGLNRLYLNTLETNDVAVKLYRKLGFIEEGRARQAIFRDGQYQDLIWMSLLRDEYLAKYMG